jgi:hypothetical protein
LDLLLDKLKQWHYGRLVHLGTLLEEGYKPQEVGSSQIHRLI